ncbi:GNAT family N-acetyltransferase [Rhodanobacter glycinis]|nr:GNAT family N-acetyltransferase [Rhodanobacter glycinis]
MDRIASRHSGNLQEPAMMSGFKQHLPWMVRRAGLQDAGTLVILCAEHARYERAPYDRAGKAALLERVLSDEPSRLTVWLAEANGKAIGYVTATSEFSTWSASDFLHMDCLFVREGCRGMGVGAALLATLVGFAHERGYAEVQWQTPDWNTEAERFYRREGALAQCKLRFSLAIGASEGGGESFSVTPSSQ